MENVIAQAGLTADEQKMFNFLQLLSESKKKTKSYVGAYKLLHDLIEKSEVKLKLPILESNIWRETNNPPINAKGERVFFKAFITEHISCFIGKKGAIGISLHTDEHKVFSAQPGTDGRQWWGEEKNCPMENYSTHLKSLIKPSEQ